MRDEAFTGAEALRTFIALDLPPEVKGYLARLQERLRAAAMESSRPLPVRWAAPAGIHLTLKFLGDVPSPQLEGIYRAVERAAEGCGPLRLAFGALGAFPSRQRPRVLWIGLEGDLAELGALQRRVEEQLAPLGFPPEGRFVPHLTLGRVRDQASPAEKAALGRLLGTLSPGEAAAFRVEAVQVIRSQLRPEGPRYTVLFTVPLAG